MRFFALILAAALVGCSQPAVHPPEADAPVDARDYFGPSVMRLHPIFTQIKSFSGGNKPEGIEAVLEFDDRFGDPTKAAGAVIFELYDMRRGYPDPRGDRVVQPWMASLAAVAQQQAHWRREIGAYSFLLAYEQINANHNYVLTATFEPVSGPRLFAQTIIQGRSADAETH
jgi:hypothetical protein